MLGAAGGVGRVTLALVERHPLARQLRAGSELLLLDRVPEASPSAALPGRWLPAASVDSAHDLAELLRRHAVDEVIELGSVGTWDCVEACAAHGVSYLTTTYSSWDMPGLDPPRSMVRARELFAPPDVDDGVHLIGMGMNPGLINLLVAAGLRELAARSGRPASLDALDLHAILLTEVDGTETVDPPPDPRECFAVTWNPEDCLEELLEPQAMITVAGELCDLDHPPHRAGYRARCGDEEITGFLVPHEELVTLGAMYPSVELAYVYRLPQPALSALAARPERTAADWPTRRLYPPDCTGLRGFDRLGALLCSRSLGELWIGWETPVAQGLELGSNATLLQVGAGVIAGWLALRELEPGVWLPEELDHSRVLPWAEAILGPPTVIWDRDATPRSVAQRRVSAG